MLSASLLYHMNDSSATDFVWNILTAFAGPAILGLKAWKIQDWHLIHFVTYQQTLVCSCKQNHPVCLYTMLHSDTAQRHNHQLCVGTSFLCNLVHRYIGNHLCHPHTVLHSHMVHWHNHLYLHHKPHLHRHKMWNRLGYKSAFTTQSDRNQGWEKTYTSRNAFHEDYLTKEEMLKLWQSEIQKITEFM